MFNFFIFLRYNIFFSSSLFKFLIFSNRSFLFAFKPRFLCSGFRKTSKPFFGFFAFSNVYFDFIGGRFGFNLFLI